MLARLLTLIEADRAEARPALDKLFAHSGRAQLVGVTGAPGAGKSSLVSQLARCFRTMSPTPAPHALRVAIVAVDPSSPFSGGALLGDRVRMRDLAGDPGIFIRSLATRGASGGLARAVHGAALALDAAGFDIILIETVGAGQAEIDITRLAHTTILVEAPGMGDDIQALKAGILEAADILVVNKADLPGVERTESALRAMLAMASTALEGDWRTPVLRVSALEGTGIAELAQAVLQHGGYLKSSGQLQQREARRLQMELDALIESTLVARWQAALPEGLYQETLQQLALRQISPLRAAHDLLEVRP